jgi:hypothetical protein
MAEDYSWDGDWSGIESEEERARLEAELSRECCPGHVLFGRKGTAVGRRWKRDDVLFKLADGRFAQVHLTWYVESSPDWPNGEIYATFEDWKAVPPEDR